MAFDGITIAAMVRELHLNLDGGRFNKIAQPEADELLITGKGANGQCRLLLSASASLPLIYFTSKNKPSPMTAPNFCMLLRKHLVGGKLAAITQPRMERLVDLAFDCTDEMGSPTQKHLILEIMGRNSNLILTDGEGRILDCLRRVDFEMSAERQVLPGLYYHQPPRQDKQEIFGQTPESVFALLQGWHEGQPFDKWLLDTFGGIPPLVCREVTVQIFGALDAPYRPADGPLAGALADALDRLSAELYDEAMDLAEDLDELPLGDTLYSGQIAQTVTRADENCLSLLFEEQRNDGTDEPDWEYEAYNFDPATGAELTLGDVFDDAGMLPDMLETRLRERYPQTEFKDLWPVVSSGTVWEEQGQTEPDPEFEWTLSYEGVEFYFEPGLIADYAAGPFHVTVRYVDEPIAVAAKFRRIPAAYAELLEHPAERTLDLDSDGQLDTLLTEIPAQFGESGWAVPTLEVTINGEKMRIDCPENAIRVQL